MSIDPLISAYQKDLLETKKALAAQTKYIEHLEEVLQEIRDVAACSDGVEFYVMLADKGLNYEG